MSERDTTAFTRRELLAGAVAGSLAAGIVHPPDATAAGARDENLIVSENRKSGATDWSRYAHVLLASNEFLFID